MLIVEILIIEEIYSNVSFFCIIPGLYVTTGNESNSGFINYLTSIVTFSFESLIITLSHTGCS